MGRGAKKTAWLLALTLAATGLAETKVVPSIQVQAEQRYDDDVLLQQNGIGQLITRLSPQVGLGAKDHTWNIKGWYSPDLLVHEDMLGVSSQANPNGPPSPNSQTSVTVDHRAGLDFKERFSPETQAEGSFKFWRVSDPTSLPRLGVGRSLAPVIYGTADLGGSTLFDPRWGLRVGHHFEATKIFDTCAPGNLAACAGDRLDTTCVGGHCSTAPGYVNAPFAEVFYRISRRTELGLGDRYQLFNFGPDFATGENPYGKYRYRFTRELTLTMLGGPTWYSDQAAHSATHGGLLPRANVTLAREGPNLDYGLTLGHDLVGASGFTNALWADYATLFTEYRFLVWPLKLFGGVSYYRNGDAADYGVWPPFAEPAGVSAGYAVDAGLEWKVNRSFALQGAFDRFAQVGNQGLAQMNLNRDIVALRMIVTAL